VRSEIPEITNKAQRASIEIAISDCVQCFAAKAWPIRRSGRFTGAIPNLPGRLEIIKNF
jgi:hypothetical protein